MKNGFTLVELSIVLVIIGLLIGGLLVGQSLIESAKINAQVQQLSQFDTSVSLFHEKFQALPGDSTHFGGNGDGAIARIGGGGATFTDSSNWDVNGFDDEIANFWSSLFPDSYEGKSYSTFTIIPEGGKQAPSARMNSNDAVIVAMSHANSGGFRADLVNIRNHYVMMTETNFLSNNIFRSGSSGQRAAKPIELYALDYKMDDKGADSGFIAAASVNHSSYRVGQLFNCSTGANYNTTNDSYDCIPFIRMGGSLGFGY